MSWPRAWWEQNWRDRSASSATRSIVGRNGVIPDLACAIESPVRVSADPTVAGRVLELALSIPTPVWGRDELRAGEMWNSNSVTSWLLCRSGTDIRDIRPPGNGRAPGWDTGRTIAERVEAEPERSRLIERSGTASLSE